MAEQNRVEIVFSAQDQLTPQIRQMQQTLRELGQQAELDAGFLAHMSAGLADLQRQEQATTTATGNLAQSTVLVAQALAQQTDAFVKAEAATLAYKQQQDALREVQRAASQEAREGAQVWQNLLTVAGGIGLATSFSSLISQVREFVTGLRDAGMQMEQLRAGMAGAAGGPAGGARAMAEATETAQRLGFGLQSLAQTYKMLMVAGQELNLPHEQMRLLFNSLAEGARVNQLSDEQLTAAVRGLERMLAQGQVTAQGFRGILVSMPQIFQVAAEAFGYSGTKLHDFRTAMQDIPIETFVRVLGPALHDYFAKQLPEAMDTTVAAQNRAANAWLLWREDMAKNTGVLATFRSAYEGVQKLFQTPGPSPQTIQQVTGGLTPQQQTAAMGPEVDRLARLSEEMVRIEQQIAETRARAQLPGGYQSTTELTRLASLEDLLKQRTAERDALMAQIQARGEAQGGQVRVPDVQAYNEQLTQIFKNLDEQLTRINKTAAELPGTLNADNAAADLMRQRLQAVQDALQKIGQLRLTGPLSAENRQRLDEYNAMALALQDLLRRETSLTQQDEERRRQSMTTGRNYLETVDQEIQKDDEARRQLVALINGYAAATDGLHNAADARKELTAAQIAAQRPNSQEIQDLAQLAESSAALAQRDRLAQAAYRQAIASYLAYQDAQEQFQRKLDTAQAQAEAPLTMRPSARLRAEAPGGDITREQAAQLRLIDAATLAQSQARDIAGIYRQLGQSIEQSISSAFEAGFTNGTVSARNFAVSLLQGLQRTFSQLALALVNQLLNVLARTSQAEGGWSSVLLKILGGVVSGLVGGSVASAAQSAALSSGTTSGVGPYVTGQDAPLVTIARATGGLIPAMSGMLAMQRGGIVNRPTFALIGERPGQHEAVVPLPDNRSIPVTLTGRAEPAPVVINLVQSFEGAIDPRALFPTRQEVVPIVVKDISQDGVARRAILRHATR